MTEEKLVPVFIPALVAILLNAEDRKGAPLSMEEVISIRDGAVVMMLDSDGAERMSESRGYRDVDPENCWYDWQMMRRELGRKPDLDPGARLNFHKGGDAIQEASDKARSSLPAFRDLMQGFAGVQIFPLIKVELADRAYSAFIWLSVRATRSDGFSAEVFELPREFVDYRVGQLFEINDNQIFDWMLNDNGTLHGGYTLRVQREAMSEQERQQFDRHVGVERYA